MCVCESRVKVIKVRPSPTSGGSALGPGAQAPKLWLGTKFSRTLDTLWSIGSQKN